MYPENYVKLRFLENHDRPRARQTIRDNDALWNWTAFMYFQKGMPLLFNGQELGATHQPMLFEKDPVCREPEVDLTGLLRRLSAIRRDPLFADSVYEVKAAPRDILVAQHAKNGRRIVGVFSVRGESGLVEVALPNGTYENLLGGTVEIHDGYLATAGQPIIVKSE